MSIAVVAVNKFVNLADVAVTLVVNLLLVLKHLKRIIQMNKRDQLCSELLSIENEMEFRKENNLATDELEARKKAINTQLARIKKRERSNDQPDSSE